MKKLLLVAALVAGATVANAQNLQMLYEGQNAGSDLTINLDENNWLDDGFGSREFEVSLYPNMANGQTANLTFSIRCTEEGKYEYDGSTQAPFFSPCTFNFPDNNNCWSLPTTGLELKITNDGKSNFHCTYSIDDIENVPEMRSVYTFSWTGDDTGSFSLILVSASASVNGIQSDNAPKRYFNLQGVELTAPCPGINIVRQGTKTWKQLH